MSVDRSKDRFQAILIPDERITVDRLFAKDDATTPSTYTEASPHTGPAQSTSGSSMVLASSGTQSQDGSLEVVATRPGHPGPDDAGFLWRDLTAGDKVSEYMGWEGQQLLTGWATLEYGTAATGNDGMFPDVIRLDSGKLLAAHTLTTLGVFKLSLYDPASSTWAAKTLAPDGAGSAAVHKHITICQLPPSTDQDTGRILAFLSTSDLDQVDAYYSDDEGTNWKALGYRVLNSQVSVDTTAVHKIRARYSSGEVLLLVSFQYSSPGVLDLQQFASSSLGASFDAVGQRFSLESPTGENAFAPDAIGLPQGGFLVLYRDDDPSPEEWNVRGIGSAFERLVSAEKAQVGTAVAGVHKAGGALFLDEDDTVKTILDGGNYKLRTSRSLDYGATWSPYGQGFIDVLGSGNDSVHTIAAGSVGGKTAILGRWEAETDNHDPYSVFVLWAGGHGRQTAPAGIETVDFLESDYVSFTEGTTLPGDHFVPIDIPGSLGWTVAGAGAEALTAAGATDGSGLLEITTGAVAVRNFEREHDTRAVGVLPRDAKAVFAEVALEVDAGSGDKTTLEIAARFRLTDGDAGNAATFNHEISVRVDDTGFRLYDEHSGGSLGEVTIANAHLKRLRIRVALDGGGKVRCWYTQGTPHYRPWVPGPTGAALQNNALAAPNDKSRITWGHLASGVNKSRWELVGAAWWADQWVSHDTAPIGSAWSNPDDLTPRNFPTRPALLADGVYLQALDGPAYFGDIWNINSNHHYPLRALDWQHDPSPQQTWRSVSDDSTVDLVFDLEDVATSSLLESTSVGFFFLNSNIKAARIYAWTGAWTLIAEADASDGFKAQPFLRNGRVIRVDTGSAFVGSNWLWYDAHAGDTWEVTAGGGDDTFLRRIEHNTEGAWTDRTTKRPRLVLRDITDGEPANGQHAIWRRNFGVAVHQWGGAERIKIEIPAHKTVDGYYQIGQLVAGSLVAFGHQYDRGFSRTRTFNVQASDRPNGGRRLTQRGPARRQVEISWAETAVDASRAQASSPLPDYIVGQTGGTPIASTVDTLDAVAGALERQQGGAKPLIYLARVPRSAGGAGAVHQYTVDRLWVYGRAETEPSIDHVTGDEGVSELSRLNTITITEEA